MRWTRKNAHMHRKRRTRQKFLWWPERGLGDEYRWLEWAWVEEEFSEFLGKWTVRYFRDGMEDQE